MNSPDPRVARVVLVDGQGALRGALPAVPVATPWWQDIAPVVAAVREHYGIDVTVLRLLEADRPTPHGGVVTYLAEGPDHARLSPWPGSLPPHPMRLPYAEPGGPAADLAWASDVLAGLRLPPAGAPQQVRTWNLSSLWRIPLTDQIAWLKHVPPMFAHEGTVISALFAIGAPVPTLLGHAGARILMAEIPGPDRDDDTDPALLRAMIDILVTIQGQWCGRTEALLTMGLPDWRAEPLSAAIADVLDRTASQLGPDDRQALDRFVAQQPARFAALAACGIPDTIVHGDCHPGNFRGPDDSLVLLDWGDCGVGHPFLDMASLLQDIPPHRVAAIRDHWHARWRAVISGCDPVRAADLIAPIAAARQAVIYRRFLDNIEPAEHPYHAADPAEWLQRAAALAVASQQL